MPGHPGHSASILSCALGGWLLAADCLLAGLGSWVPSWMTGSLAGSWQCSWLLLEP